jgi:heme A synthase
MTREGIPMKRTLIAVLALATLLLLAASVANADSDRAAIVGRVDSGPWWYAWADGTLYSATGSGMGVATQNGKWHASSWSDTYDTDYGPAMNRALVLVSSPDQPLGTCCSPVGCTYKWQMVFAPSGQTKFTCEGDYIP